MRIPGLLGGFALCLAASCSSGVSHTGEPPSDAARAYGWRAYTGERITGVDGLGPAIDATVTDFAGRPFQLATAWAEHNAILVFYRGDW